jgi:hypothetical protein
MTLPVPDGAGSESAVQATLPSAAPITVAVAAGLAPGAISQVQVPITNQPQEGLAKHELDWMIGHEVASISTFGFCCCLGAICNPSAIFYVFWCLLASGATTLNFFAACGLDQGGCCGGCRDGCGGCLVGRRDARAQAKLFFKILGVALLIRLLLLVWLLAFPPHRLKRYGSVSFVFVLTAIVGVGVFANALGTAVGAWRGWVQDRMINSEGADRTSDEAAGRLEDGQ